MGILSDFLDGKRLDQDSFRQTGADAKSGVANLANKTALAAEEFDFLFLTKTHLAEAMRHFRGAGEMFDANGHACIHAAQRAKERLRAMLAGSGLFQMRFVHVKKKSKRYETQLQERFSSLALASDASLASRLS